jgi:glycosyltransferase involved in cell wall biosynthesis
VIRIVHLITGLDLGGAEIALAKLAAGLDPTRFQSKVVSLIEPGRVAADIRGHGVPVISLGLDRGRPTLAGLARMIALLRRERPAILQTWLYHADMLGLIAGRLAGTPRIVWNIRASNMTEGKDARHLRSLVRALAYLSRQPDAVVVNSSAGRRAHAELGYRPRRWVEIPNGVDTGRFRPRPAERDSLRRALGIPESARAVGIAARLHAMKDYATFFAAAARLAQRPPDAFFVVTGDGCGPDSRELGDMIAASGLGARVRLLGVRDLADVFPALDIVTLSSAFGEGFPNVLIEAMSCGVPCVATDVGDSAHIIGDAGRVVPPADPTALAAAWDEVLRSDLPTLGLVARNRAQSLFDLKRMCAAYETLYSELSR